jgi:hypothetical protein
MDMHRSRLAGFIIDCEGADPDAAARFWGAKQTHAGSWVVMIAPTGQRFCVVRATTELSHAPGASAWEEA